MKNYIPKTNDLIIFSNKSSAILSDSDSNNPNYKWSESIVSIEPNQSALVIDTHIINHPAANKPNSILILRKQLLSNTTTIDNHLPKPITLLVVSLSNLILEILYDPDTLTVFPHPVNLVPVIKPSVYLIMAR